MSAKIKVKTRKTKHGTTHKWHSVGGNGEEMAGSTPSQHLYNLADMENNMLKTKEAIEHYFANKK